MSKMMKAIRMYAPRDLRLEQVPVPEIKENEALVKVIAVGICGSDIPRINQYGAYISPITPGHEFSGEIVETGAAVGDTERVSYRLDLSNDRGPQVVEQQAYHRCADGRIIHLRVLCSGFRPR